MTSSPTATSDAAGRAHAGCPHDHERGPAAHDGLIRGPDRLHREADEGHAAPRVDAGDLRGGIDDVAGVHRRRPFEGLLAVDETGKVDADLRVAEELRERRAEAVDGCERRRDRIGLSDVGPTRRSPLATARAASGAMRWPGAEYRRPTWL